MAGYGMPEAHVAAIVGVDAKTLRKHYRSELDLGHIKANSAVAQSLFRKATGDGPQSVTAAIFWMKTRLGWKETARLEHAAGDCAPLPIQIIRFSDLTPEAMTTVRADRNGKNALTLDT